jgi:hypothetical protein
MGRKCPSQWKLPAQLLPKWSFISHSVVLPCLFFIISYIYFAFQNMAWKMLEYGIGEIMHELTSAANLVQHRNEIKV